MLPAIFVLLLIFIFTGCSQGQTPVPDGRAEGGDCASCHGDYVAAFDESTHGFVGVTCADCHDSLDAHLRSRNNLPGMDVRGDACASCHSDIHNEWLSSPHAQIPLDLFPNDPRIMSCMKCHQASGFAAVINSGDDFKTAWAPPPTTEPEPITCVACHSPHNQRDAQMLRLPKDELCATCHNSKWQNQVAMANPPDPYMIPGEHDYFSGEPLPVLDHPFGDRDYSMFANHPHSSGDRCATCHMARTPDVPELGGHTFSMRTTPQGLQNTAACVACHEGADSYNINNKQDEVAQLLFSLRSELEERNNGALPGNQPGTCNQCHKGGSLPFDNDPDLILANAYESYKQIDRDKSLGVHNTPFALQLLRDALEAIETLYSK